MRVTLALALAAIGRCGWSMAQEHAPKPLPAEVVAAWEKAGAEFGWMQINEIGQRVYRGALYPGRPGELAAFRMMQWKPGVVGQLPAPAQSFGLVLGSTPLTDIGLKEVAGFKELQVLSVGSTQVTDDGLRELAALQKLQSLDLGLTKVTNKGLKHLAALSQLQWLGLSYTQVSDEGLKDLSALKQLQTLILSATKVTGVGLKELASLQQLRTLHLSYTKLSDAGMKEVALLKNLRELSFSGTAVSDVGLKELSGLKELRVLYLGNGVSDDGLKHLAGMKLKILDLRDSSAKTDVGLKNYLAAVEPPKTLNLCEWNVTAAGLKELASHKELETLVLPVNSSD